MGAAIKALLDGAKIIKRRPTVLLVGAGAVIFAWVLTALLGFIPLVGPLIANVLVVPLALGGMIGACRAVAKGEGPGSGFLSALSDDWLGLIGAYGLLQLLAIGVGIVVAVVLVVVMFVLVFTLPAASSGGGGGGGGALTAGLFGGLLIVLYVGLGLAGLVFGMIVQFIDAAVVIDDASPVGAFTRSWNLVKTGPLSVLGYTLLRGIVANLVILGPGLLVVVLSIGAESLGVNPNLGLILGAAGSLVIAPLAFTYQMAYHTAYFGRRTA